MYDCLYPITNILEPLHLAHPSHRILDTIAFFLPANPTGPSFALAMGVGQDGVKIYVASDEKEDEDTIAVECRTVIKAIWQATRTLRSAPSTSTPDIDNIDAHADFIAYLYARHLPILQHNLLTHKSRFYRVHELSKGRWKFTRGAVHHQYLDAAQTIVEEVERLVEKVSKVDVNLKEVYVDFHRRIREAYKALPSDSDIMPELFEVLVMETQEPAATPFNVMKWIDALLAPFKNFIDLVKASETHRQILQLPHEVVYVPLPATLPSPHLTIPRPTDDQIRAFLRKCNNDALDARRKSPYYIPHRSLLPVELEQAILPNMLEGVQVLVREREGPTLTHPQSALRVCMPHPESTLTRHLLSPERAGVYPYIGLSRLEPSCFLCGLYMERVGDYMERLRKEGMRKREGGNVKWEGYQAERKARERERFRTRGYDVTDIVPLLSLPFPLPSPPKCEPESTSPISSSNTSSLVSLNDCLSISSKDPSPTSSNDPPQNDTSPSSSCDLTLAAPTDPWGVNAIDSHDLDAHVLSSTLKTLQELVSDTFRTILLNEEEARQSKYLYRKAQEERNRQPEGERDAFKYDWAWAKENEPEIYKALKAAGMAPDSDSDSEEEGEGESGEEQG
ncbi:hypothetical protein CC1G_00912 [Coprinopsis cinerea okayama7|uniref:Uncharacterized protein n=1 Tax=Coprinopsis cinerea (strain Okayama-7 / 130 / ATCC MYA-4618 / FGSC 9003) TaxID=240176 RepID=A8N937_COPC7|nr:hypothetical protein CC1G_00912 [Coprinopsis cinerea okayama7\|eukprot:XP_001831365.2 hypothetical protein CC1G_00912 [Coprinopsis cinerea okayama7\